MIRPPHRPLELSIVLPCRNEQASIEEVVAGALEHGARTARRIEVIPVDDGSADATGKIADRLAAGDPRVRAIHNRPGLGYGGALASGFRAATFPWVFYTDGDGQFDLSQIPEAVALLERCDVVAGYRELRVESLARRTAGRLWTAIVDATFGLAVRDLDCAFKLLPRGVVEGGELGELCSRGALVSAELLYRAQALGLRIEELPVRHLPRRGGRATGASPRVVARAAYELVTLTARIKAGARSRGQA